MTIDTGEER